MDRPIGIDDINLYAGRFAVDFESIARARGLSARELDVVQFRRRSVTTPSEDPVTLAATAALPLVEAAGRDQFGLLIAATESGLDYGKPLSSYIHRHLGLSARCRHLELKYACYGGTAAIHFAVSWLRSEAAPGQKALVVMSDLARRHVGDPAELSAGSGAVAVVVSAEPRILRIESSGGYACREIYDVARPTPVGEWGDPVLSLAAYLDLLEEAWADFQQRSASSLSLDRRFRYMLYHTPLLSLVRQAHGVLLQAQDDCLEAAAMQESFDRMVAPAFGFARELANVYSGSVYCLLAGLVEHAPDLSPGATVGIYSYGSGSCAGIYGGIIADQARSTVARHCIGARLDRRRTVDVDEYERLARETDVMLTSRDYEPADDSARDEGTSLGESRLVLERIRNHHRQYAWLG